MAILGEHTDGTFQETLVVPERICHPRPALLLPDHATPCASRTHTSEPVPYLLYGTDLERAGGEYTERGVAGQVPVPAHDLMARLLA